MRDYDALVDGNAGIKPRESKRPEEDHVGVAKAIERGRPDTLSPKGVLHLQRVAGNAGVGAFLQRQEDESPVKDVIRSSGQPLDHSTRQFMETRFGHDFSGVQVHTDPAAASSAKSVQAHAYTVGDHIVFGEGRYQPGSDDGRRTLAHELTHVVQQRTGPVDGTPAPGGIQLSDPSDRFEREAEHTAQSVVSSDAAAPALAGSTSAGGAGIQRHADCDADGAVQRAMAGPGEQPDEALEEAPTTAQGLYIQRQDMATDEEEGAV